MHLHHSLCCVRKTISLQKTWTWDIYQKKNLSFLVLHIKYFRRYIFSAAVKSRSHKTRRISIENYFFPRFIFLSFISLFPLSRSCILPRGEMYWWLLISCLLPSFITIPWCFFCTFKKAEKLSNLIMLLSSTKYTRTKSNFLSKAAMLAKMATFPSWFRVWPCSLLVLPRLRLIASLTRFYLPTKKDLS